MIITPLPMKHSVYFHCTPIKARFIIQFDKYKVQSSELEYVTWSHYINIYNTAHQAHKSTLLHLLQFVGCLNTMICYCHISDSQIVVRYLLQPDHYVTMLTDLQFTSSKKPSNTCPRMMKTCQTLLK